MIPPAVRVIKAGAFCSCSQLAIVILGEGLEEIEEDAFRECMSLREIVIPLAVRKIKKRTFLCCSQLAIVVLGEGLEEIGKWAFRECTSLREIVIPPAVRVIHDEAFHECSQLTNVQFCNEIEEFVSGESMRDWWNHGVHERSLSTYCFLVQSNISERLGLVRQRIWQANIHGMLSCIPSISPKGLDLFYDSIKSKLSAYENLKDAPMLLKLAIWKSKLTEQSDRNNGLLTIEMRMQCCTDSVTMVTFVVPNVLSFLTDG